MKNNRNKGKLIRIFICQLNELDGFKEYLEKKAAQGWMLEKRQGLHHQKNGRTVYRCYSIESKEQLEH